MSKSIGMENNLKWLVGFDNKGRINIDGDHIAEELYPEHIGVLAPGGFRIHGFKGKLLRELNGAFKNNRR